MKKVLELLLTALLLLSCMSLFVSAADLTNVAQGKTYTVDIGESGTASYGYPDGYGDGPAAERQLLTDGNIATDNGDAGTGAQQTSLGVYVIDLGSVVDGIKKLNMDMYGCEGWGVGVPISVEYAISTNGTDYTTVGTVLVDGAVAKGVGDWVGYDFILELTEAQSAQYVKMTASATNYIWSTEMQVFAESATTTPDTGDNVAVLIVLLVVAAAGSIIVTSRKFAK
ncbi:MAG: hypothetical protein A2Y17_02645 [Clostridiales bacterium GWF2_38_85]|nr:MAG: hypothetical protein A2Y17_02645 [Clostridiales bacterium GWF2_38_85]